MHRRHDVVKYLLLREVDWAAMLVLGIEGSANKVGVGIVSDDGVIHANPRHT